MFKLPKWHLQYSQNAKSKRVPAKILYWSDILYRFFDAATKDNFPLNFELLLKETKNKVQLRADAAAEDNLIKKDADPQTVKLLLKETKN